MTTPSLSELISRIDGLVEAAMAYVNRMPVSDGTRLIWELVKALRTIRAELEAKERENERLREMNQAVLKSQYEAFARAEAAASQLRAMAEVNTEMRKALGNTQCPRPPNSVPEKITDWTVEQCMASGDCGCDSGAAISKSESADVLKKARALIEKPEDWIGGEPPVWGQSPFCAATAIWATHMGAVAEGIAYRCLCIAMDVNAARDFNDNATHAEVLAAFDRAIELATPSAPGSPMVNPPSNGEGK